ncbi:hypothetical protein [Kibdelosporangium phytohabitans]|uniref:Uncharacterized protein n=1 Tax=Kibdelosporangium phytohabitans TaxID=860235 RepID=A0A0N9I705_9PSEU|nr:hypothetical protein [Kibdelosporangium phytohabitans]ALG11508.1 hypothetical protein AOZ06_35720 [Kibdelosporangium phytohabitans]MBE1462861.1 hypothetical protein [Kibdelosporangium phytohabitans]
MPEITNRNQPTAQNADQDQPAGEIVHLDRRAAEIVAAQAPPLARNGAHVSRRNRRPKADTDVSVLGWGMEFADSTAYVVSADGQNQYFLAEAENALMYIRTSPEAIADLIWLTGDPRDQEKDRTPSTMG